MFREVIEFNVLIGNPVKDKPEILPPNQAQWLNSALNEEADEFLDAVEIEVDFAAAVDGLIDSIYFGIGGMHRMGLTPAHMQAAFNIVHWANMTKKRGIVPTRVNDGTVTDAVKPAGFVDPKDRIRKILALPLGDVEHFVGLPEAAALEYLDAR